MSGDSDERLEKILKHLIDPINSRLDRLNDSFDKLQSHQFIVPQLALRVEDLEKVVLKQKEITQKLVYDSDKREDIKKSITNPLIMRAAWSVMGVMGCCACIAIGFSYKQIDQKSKEEMVKLIRSQSH